jgi:hypothetical protein
LLRAFTGAGAIRSCTVFRGISSASICGVRPVGPAGLPPRGPPHLLLLATSTSSPSPLQFDRKTRNPRTATCARRPPARPANCQTASRTGLRFQQRYCSNRSRTPENFGHTCPGPHAHPRGPHCHTRHSSNHCRKGFTPPDLSPPTCSEKLASQQNMTHGSAAQHPGAMAAQQSSASNAAAP